jgi:hypothetical protein
MFPSRPRGQGLLLARDRWRPSLCNQAAVDPGAGRRHQGFVRDNARRPGRVRRPALARGRRGAAGVAREARGRRRRLVPDPENRTTEEPNWQSSRSATCT